MKIKIKQILQVWQIKLSQLNNIIHLITSISEDLKRLTPNREKIIDFILEERLRIFN